MVNSETGTRQPTVAASPRSTSPIEGRFRLTDHNGREVTERDFRGRYVLVFFGFTHCRVVCPRALERISRVLDGLGPRAASVQPVYISVDPARDTPEVMKAFLEQRYPRFLGLTGTQEQIDAAKRAFRVFAERKPDPEDPAGYAVPHTAITYLLDPDGAYCAHFPDVVGEQELLRRISAILDGGPSRQRTAGAEAQDGGD